LPPVIPYRRDLPEQEAFINVKIPGLHEEEPGSLAKKSAAEMEKEMAPLIAHLKAKDDAFNKEMRLLAGDKFDERAYRIRHIT
jgi:hypothetical protein